LQERRPPDVLSPELLAQGQHVMTVCNACRYCEAYCPVFQAMENRTSFAKGDMLYLANLCHNCGECLYACQYAPPHEFGIDVPRVLAETRVASYEEFCWPALMRPAFRQNATMLGPIVGSFFLAWILRLLVQSSRPQGDFYAVIPHDDMVALFGAVGVYAVVVLLVGFVRAMRSFETPATAAFSRHAWGDVLSLRHLHATGADCTSGVERRTPWRRYFHHCTFYGFGLCFFSTTVAAVYHVVFGWVAPYAYISLPVVLGTAGGIGLVIGPIGLLVERTRRDPQLGAPGQAALDVSFILMLFMTSATGLLLLTLREHQAMPVLLLVHLGFVLVLLLTLPHTKFVHGLYRMAALFKFSTESQR
jgi:citrate/tricarballylate utilization protein